MLDLETGEITYPGDGVTRGIVRGFSADSRRRLRIRLMEVPWDELDSYWVTLTYHQRWGEDWQSWKADLRRFRKRLQRAWAPIGGFWRFEFQRRGAPHFHLVISWGRSGGPDRAVFRAWVRAAWSAVTGESENRAHLAHGTQTVKVDRTDKGHLGKLMGYLVKEMSKTKQAEGQPTGRQWGRFGDLPARTIAEVELTDEGYCELARRVADQGKGWFADSLSGKWSGFVCLGDGRSQLDDLLADLPGGVVFVGGR